MSQAPYFSIIIPTLSEAKFLPTLLTDLTKQTNQDFEVIIVDAKSKDKTLKVAESFSSRLPSLVILESSKKNISFQRNLGAKKSQGQILLFIDADSGLPPFFLDGIRYKLSKLPTDFFTTWIKADSPNTQDAAIATIINLAFETSRFLDLPTAFGAMLGFKRQVFQKIGGFNEKITYAEDQEIIRRSTAKKFKFLIYPDPPYIYSLRRLRRQGTLNSLRQFISLQTKLLTNGYSVDAKRDYPMGGHYFTTPPSPIPFWKKIFRFVKT